MDYENWDDERQDIIDDTIGVLRDQRDDEAEAAFGGSFAFNPQVMTKGQTMVVGPVTFEEPFANTPRIVFGQSVTGVQLSIGVGSSTTPFLVAPFVSSLSFTNGKVDGFWLGLYALTDVPAGVIVHTIDWEAKGKGSPYRQEQLQESWTEEYDSNEADFLVEEAIDDEDF